MIRQILRAYPEDAYAKSVADSHFQTLMRDAHRLQERLRLRIETHCVCPPIPTRAYDWQAYVEGSIDVCGDPDCGCRSKVVIGTGETEESAIDDLLEQMNVKV